MSNNPISNQAPIRFRRFGNKGWSLFACLGRTVLIGTLSVATLSHAKASGISTLQPRLAMEAEEDTFLGDSIIQGGEIGELEVLGTLVPMSADKAARMVQVLTRQDIQGSPAHSVNDLLKFLSGVDVRQRGAFSVQTDIGVAGGTQDQVTVLLNGVNITSPHTGHLTMDLPVSIDDIERIEVLSGGASRTYGASAFSGAINIVTRGTQSNSLDLSLAGGSFGTAQGGASLSLRTGRLGQRISGSYSRSDGGASNSDFERATAFWNGRYRSPLIDLNWQAGYSSQDYGANTFYSARYGNQYEENRHILASVSGEYKGTVHILPQLYWNRSFDHYVLNRLNPSAYENFHRADTYGAALTGYVSWLFMKTSLGVEVRQENILSTSLGRPMDEADWQQVPGRTARYKNKDSRTNTSLFLEHDFLFDRLTLSLGLLATRNTALSQGMRLYPGIDLSWRPTDRMRLFASCNQSLRMPTYTDLYYTGPSLEGNPNLRPERSTDLSLGYEYSLPYLQLRAKGFYRRGTDMIDWVKYTADDANHSANFDLDYWGLDLSAHLDGRTLWGNNTFMQTATLSWSHVTQNRVTADAAIYSSQYAGDYLRNKLTATLRHRIWSHLSAEWTFMLKDRHGTFEHYDIPSATYTEQAYGTHALLDLRLDWTRPSHTIYVSMNNLTSKRYYDLSNVCQPGFWLMAGIKLHLTSF